MARNRQDLVRALSAVTSELLKEKGYICFVDVLMKLDYLSKSDYEHWRFQRVSPLERVLRVNLSRINFIMKTVGAPQQPQWSLKTQHNGLQVVGHRQEDAAAIFQIR